MPVVLYTPITYAIAAVMALLSHRVVSHGPWGRIGKRARRLFQNMIKCAAARCAGKRSFGVINMAQLYFYYSAMNAGKSTALLQPYYNYQERGIETLILTAEIDQRDGIGRVSSRIGLSAPALVFNLQTDLLTLLVNVQREQPVHCILIDECQFLTLEQVNQLSDIVDELDIPVLCYGLRTDFQGELFSGSQYLLDWADKLIELKTVYHCGRKANRVLRLDTQGNPLREGEQVVIGAMSAMYPSAANTTKAHWD